MKIDCKTCLVFWHPVYPRIFKYQYTHILLLCYYAGICKKLKPESCLEEYQELYSALKFWIQVAIIMKVFFYPSRIQKIKEKWQWTNTKKSGIGRRQFLYLYITALESLSIHEKSKDDQNKPEILSLKHKLYLSILKKKMGRQGDPVVPIRENVQIHLVKVSIKKCYYSKTRKSERKCAGFKFLLDIHRPELPTVG